jgi:hypothetical protein
MAEKSIANVMTADQLAEIVRKENETLVRVKTSDLYRDVEIHIPEMKKHILLKDVCFLITKEEQDQIAADFLRVIERIAALESELAEAKGLIEDLNEVVGIARCTPETDKDFIEECLTRSRAYLATKAEKEEE